MKLDALRIAVTLIVLSPILLQGQSARPKKEIAAPNLLLITVDDMNCDSVGVFGCELTGTSPHMDALAQKGLRFEMAHVQVGNCFPSRNVMWSGRYPHNTGVEGFYHVKPIDFPVLTTVMQDAGYYVAIRGKVSHSTPYHPFPWDEDLTLNPDGSKEHTKDVESFYRSTKRGIENAAEEGKKFCLNINISDPHKPFWFEGDKHGVSKTFTSDEVPVPKFLPDDPAIREELALYYTSVRRADDAVGAIMRALEESGKAEETFVMFLSDHGMPLPFAKTQLYHHSTHTPLIVIWPGVTSADSIDDSHMVSAVDFLPTLCDVIGVEKPEGMDGRSFGALLRGRKQKNRDFVYKVYNENSGGNRHPMRGLQTPDYLYLFNPWADGENVFRTATTGTDSYRTLKRLAESDEKIAARLDLFDHRVVEELYDIRQDPDCLHNLIDSTDHQAVLTQLRSQIEDVMKKSGDHTLEVFQNREDPSARKAYIDKVNEEAQARRAERRSKKKKPTPKTKKNSKKKNAA